MKEKDSSPFFNEKPDEKKSGGLFQHKTAPVAEVPKELVAQVTSMSRQLKILEERYGNLRNKQQMSDQNVLNIQKDISRQLKAMNQTLLDISKENADFKDKMRLIIRELRECAKRDEVAVMRKYLDMFDFVKFATHNDVKRIVQDMMEGETDTTNR